MGMTSTKTTTVDKAAKEPSELFNLYKELETAGDKVTGIIDGAADEGRSLKTLNTDEQRSYDIANAKYVAVREKYDTLRDLESRAVSEDGDLETADADKGGADTTKKDPARAKTGHPATFSCLR